MKHNLPEKGAVVQKDMETFAVKAHMPGGFTTPDELRRVADVSEKYHVRTLKITGAQRVALIGIDEDQLDNVINDLGSLAGGAIGLCVRYVKMCPGASCCKRGWRVSQDIGMKMDQRYHGLQVPWKSKMGVSGCQNDCSEVCIKDLGLIGTQRGWKVMVGGNGGSQPRFAQVLVDDVPSDEEALEVVGKVVEWFDSKARKCRIGKIVEEMGIDVFRKEVLGI
jgi:NAD(P)H-nitrite reductase large subunit